MTLKTVLLWPSRALSALLIGTIRVHQKALSPWLGPVCRFEPSCSHYMVGAIRKHGLIRGVGKGTWRICRCHPWNPGGYDPP